MSSSEDLLNDAIQKMIPVINEKIPAWVEDANLDPWESVIAGSETLGKLDLIICKAKVKAEYKIKDMTGLSSTLIDSAEVTKVNREDEKTIDGEYQMKLELTSKLKATVKGGIEASCSGLKESVDIKGELKATKVNGTMSGNISADMTNGFCVVNMSVDKLQLDYGDIDLDINGLGIFNEFLDELLKAVELLFGDAIKGMIGDALRPVFQDLIKNELPYCT